MSKAIFGFVGGQPTDVILRELASLKARVNELERMVAVSEEPTSMRDLEELAGATSNHAALA